MTGLLKLYPEINTREAKTEYMAKCYQYLVDSVFTGPTAPMVKGMPVFYHFGPGAKVDEYKKVLSLAKLPQGMKQPVAYAVGQIGENWRLHGFLPVSVQEIRHMPNGIITPLRMMLSSL